MTEKLVSLIDRKDVAEGTTSFSFDVAGTDFTFKSGQYADLTLIDPLYTDAEGSTRSFSITSSPNDSDRITMVMRMRQSAFKKSLGEAPLGYVLKLSDAMGDFTLHKDASKPAIFIAGGIGITPFHSMIAWTLEEDMPHRTYLFYSNKTRATMPFLDEFISWARNNPKFTFIPTLTAETPSDWKYETGRIDEAMLKKHVPNIGDAVCYVAGSPSMVSSMLPVLAKAGANEDFIKTDDFSGY